ncbi:MAG: hypothetical protein ACJ73S_06755 [Mycobacteriales bacterium]|jgi:hypothetical protein
MTDDQDTGGTGGTAGTGGGERRGYGGREDVWAKATSEDQPESPIVVEARRLVEAFQDRLRDVLPPGVIATHSLECQFCPLCRLIAAMRGDRGTDAERIARMVGSVAEAVGGMLAGLGQPDRSQGPHEGPKD